MSFQKFKTNRYSLGRKQYFANKNSVGEITINKKTGREIKF